MISTSGGSSLTTIQHGFHVSDGDHAWHTRKGSGLQTAAAAGSSSTGFKGLLEISNADMLPSTSFSPSRAKIEVIGTTHPTTGVKRLVKSVIGGLNACQEPEASVDGLGGTYFFMNELGERTAIVKPCDEEPLAPNNPKGFVGRALGEPGLKPTVRVGEAALREVAAYLLDYQNFARVPNTVLVRVRHPIFHHAAAATATGEVDLGSHPGGGLSQSLKRAASRVSMDSNEATRASDAPKLGSLQEFVSHQGDSSEMGPSLFNAADVHRIGILDLRLYNTDRHAGNMLTSRPVASSRGRLSSGLSKLADAKLSLTPIDHGFCLPEALEPPYFEWQHWPQASMPFDAEELAYVQQLDVQQDVELLRRELPALREESLRTLEVSTTLLKLCCAAGLNLSEIATVISRPLVGMEEESSELEKLCQQVREEVDALTPEEIELATISGHEDDSSPEATTWDMDDMRESFTHRSSSLLSPMDSGLSVTSPAEEPGSISAKRLGLRRSALHRSAGGDDLLFDLEEGPEYAEAPEATLTSFTGSQSKPLPLSLCSSPEQHPSPFATPAQLGMPRDSGSMGSYQDSQESAQTRLSAFQAPVLASSAANGGRWPGRLGLPNQHQGRGRKHGSRFRLPRHAARSRKQVYPPHIQGRSPSTANNIFSNMDNQQWICFMDLLTDLIESALEQGKWRQSSASSSTSMPMGMSCPRF